MNIIELVDETGEKLEFEHLMTLEYLEQKYVVLAPLEEDDESEEEAVVILELIETEEGDQIFNNLTDEKLMEEVFNAFLEVNALQES